MKIVLTGATGVLGRQLVPLLLQEHAQVIALVRDTHKARQLWGNRIGYTEVDLLENLPDDHLRACCTGTDALIHLATSIPANKNDPGSWNANSRLRTVVTDKLLEACRLHRVPYFVGQSIEMAYREGGDAWLDEDADFDDSAASSHLSAPVKKMEESIRSNAPHPQYCIARGGSFVGPGTAEDGLRRDLQSGKFRLPVNAEAWQSFVQVSDMAMAILCILKWQPRGRTYNINRTPQRFNCYLKDLCKQERIAYPGETDSSFRLRSLRCSAARIETELGFRAIR